MNARTDNHLLTADETRKPRKQRSARTSADNSGTRKPSPSASAMSSDISPTSASVPPPTKEKASVRQAPPALTTTTSASASAQGGAKPTASASTQHATAASRKAKWKDPKRYQWLLSPALPVIGIAALSAYAIAPKKLRALAWTGPALVHGLIPALDRLIGEDRSNPPDEAIRDLENDRYYNLITKAFIPSQYVMTMLGCYLATRDNVPLADRLGITVSVGALNGIAIVTGHELGHKHERHNRIGAMLALAPTYYTHFAVEHNFGHHKRVSTPEDPASSRMGESFWKFLPRTVIGGIKSAIDIETKRLERKGKKFWCLENELLQGWAICGAFTAANVLVSGPRAIPFLLAQGAYGASLLEVVNYIEHYGLLRQKDENGKYERTQPEHSWNSNYVVTNLVLYQLQRHSDHHAYPARSFQALRDFPEAPQLPGGYASMLLPAYVPGWWSKIMDEKVIRHYKGDLDKINWDPERREELMAQYRELAERIAKDITDAASTDRTTEAVSSAA